MNTKTTDFSWVAVLKKTGSEWVENGALRLSAALSYYSIFSIAPLLVLALGLAGMFLGAEAVHDQLSTQLQGTLGPEAAETVESMVESASKPSDSIMATVLGIVLLLIGASGVFGQLKDALNTIWEVKAKSGRGIWALVRERLLSFGMVLVIGFLLLTSLMLTSMLTAFSGWVESAINIPKWIFAPLGLIASMGVVTVLFALIFKFLPDAKIKWRHVWIGAAATAVLFEIGKFGLGWYLGRESTASSYGAAGSVILLLLWVYYASLILLFGAEFTKVYAMAVGDEVAPKEGAEAVTDEARERAGQDVKSKNEHNDMNSNTDTDPQPQQERLSAILPAAREAARVKFPKRLDEVPAYLEANPGVAAVSALGCGIVAGIVTRVVEGRDAGNPRKQLKRGSHAFKVAALVIAGRIGKHLLRNWRLASKSQPVRTAKKALEKVAAGVAVLFFASTGMAAEKEQSAEAVAEVTRMQILLDQNNFGPGKIDGRKGEFFDKALALYRESKGEPAPSADAKAKSGDTTGAEAPADSAASGEEAFTSYTVTAEDVASVGELPKEPVDQAKLEWMPYTSVFESVAERFHSDVDFIKQLNPEVKGDLKEGDQVKVPNVQPFELASVKEIKPGSGKTPAANEEDDGEEAKVDGGEKPDSKSKKDSKAKKEDSKESASTVKIHINTKDNMLKVMDGEKVTAAFPVTIGSGETPTPVGEWKVRGLQKFPTFRYDKKMLKEGERSNDFHVLPPGPNNLVGVLWIGLNKKGIGIHGTAEPDSIGRSASHGCIRMANWDIAKLATMVKGGVAVTIE